jgi:hypothetical protein
MIKGVGSKKIGDFLIKNNGFLIDFLILNIWIWFIWILNNMILGNFLLSVINFEHFSNEFLGDSLDLFNNLIGFNIEKLILWNWVLI